MSHRAHRRERRRDRWLAAIVALLVLLSGEGLHALAHGHADVHRLPDASGRLEVHAGDCQHRPDEPAHHAAPCTLCKHGGGTQVLASPESVVRVAAPRAAPALAGPDHVASTVSVPGALGARAPPLMSA